MTTNLHIGIAGPIATEHIVELLRGNVDILPKGYPGAPLTGVLIKELLKKGHKVSAFTTDASLYTDEKIVKASGPNFDLYICPSRPRAWRLNKFRLGRALDGFIYERCQLLNAIKEAKPQLIHAHWTYEFALAAIKTGIPHLITCHDAPAVVVRFTRSLYRIMRYLVARQVFFQGRHFSAVSSYMADAAKGYTKLPISVVPNPLADYVVKLGRSREIPETKRIGMICNGWDALKNPKPALLAFKQAKIRHPSAELHMFGVDFGPEEVAQRWAEEQGISKNMFFHGPIPHKQLIEQLNGLDLLLHPSLEESFGVVVAEAMMLGLPIVAGKHSGAVPWVVGVSEHTNKQRCCAVLTDVSNPIAIASAIDEAYDQHYPERSAAGYARAAQMFAPDKIAEAYLSLYRNIISANSAPQSKPV